MARLASAALAILFVACGPDSADDYREMAKTASPERISQAWQDADSAHRERMVEGLLASESAAALLFVIERYLEEGSASPAAAVAEVAPARLGPALTPLLDPNSAGRDDAVLTLMGRCCQAKLLGAVSDRTQAALDSAGANNGTLEVRIVALERALARVPPEATAATLDGPVAQLVGGLRQSDVAAGGGCTLPAVFARSEVAPVRSALAARAAELTATCLADGQPTAAMVGYLGSLELIAGSEAAAQASLLRACAEDAQRAFDRAERLATDVSAAAARAADIRTDAESSEANLRTTITALGAYQFSGWMVAAIDDRHYEIARLTWVPYVGEVPSTDHSILRTQETSFTSPGNFRLWVAPAGTETISLQNGFSERWTVLEEQPSIPRMQIELAERQAALREAEQAVWSLRAGAESSAEEVRVQRARLDVQAGRLRQALGASSVVAPLEPAPAVEAPLDPAAPTVVSTAAAVPFRDSPEHAAPEQAAPEQAAPSLRFEPPTGSAGLGETVTFSAVVEGGVGRCALRLSYLTDGEWASRAMVAGENHAISLVVKEAMGDELLYAIDGRCANGEVSSGSRDDPYVQRIR